MNNPIYCRFNMDTACVELLLSDATLISIDTKAAEAEFADNMYHRSELDWLICNSPPRIRPIRSQRKLARLHPRSP